MPDDGPANPVDMAKLYERFDLIEVTDLFRKSLSETLTAVESSRLESILAHRPMREAYQRLSDEDFVEAKFRELEGYPYLTAFDKLKKIHRRRTLRRRIAVSAAVAAVVLAGVLGGRMLLDTSGPMPNTPVIEPGKSLAVLTLSDGRTVDIDERSICIGSDGGNHIAYEDGELVYQVNDAPAVAGHNQILVPVGGECKVQLDDKTRVWLNADSRLRYPVAFPEHERRVTLEGEAYFEVMPGDRPFIVETAGGDVTVLGTSFGISSYPGHTQFTTLVEGSVSFTAPDRRQVTLEPGEQALITTDGVLSKRKVDVNEYVGWKNGEFVFRDKPLGEIMDVLGRWYGVTTRFEDLALSELRYSGDLKRYDSINTFLELLHRLNDIHYTIEGDTICLGR